jgi:2-keto-4-pentenoate hydratase/2-oxohepta-3-ene-1,7-dioic acid hydratase in catechol pathway
LASFRAVFLCISPSEGFHAAGGAVRRSSGEGAVLSINVIRTSERWYVQRGSEAFPVDAELSSTALLLAEGLAQVRAAATATAGAVPAAGLSLRSPVTTPCRVVAQALNYGGHAQESGAGDQPPAVFFRKSSASVSGPTDDVVRPSHVRLLDYELELGLVMGRRLEIGTAVTDAELPDYVAGLVMCNDVSARDVQLEQGQFYESKSYPTFTPTGPRLVLLDVEDFGRLAGLRLRLWVNGELRQDATVADMVTRPAAALTLLARFQPLDPGDLLMTGTPGGTALQAPPAVIGKLGDLLPTPLKWRVFFSRQERNPAYLKAGDQITASIATEDGALDLGTQRTAVRDGP